MGFEDALATRAILSNNEKTNIDKVLAKDETQQLRELVKKPELARSELLDMMYLLAATESKLYKFNNYKRKIIMLFYARIREHVDMLQQLIDYIDIESAKEKNGAYVITPRTKSLLLTCRRRLDQNTKFLVQVYLNLCRTTLSMEALGFLETLKQKFELLTKSESRGLTLEDIKK